MTRNTEQKKTSFILTTIFVGVLLVIALFCFTTGNRKRITGENREYLLDNAAAIADSIDSAISDGYDNIKILSELVSKSLTGPEFDISDIQGLIQNSVFDFMEFADRDGMDHNITGGVSDARDRRYYLDARDGNCGMELICYSRATHETLLMFYSPIYYENTFVGSLVGVYQASNRITRLLSSVYFGEEAPAYLAAEDGRIIASNQNYQPQEEVYVPSLFQGDESLAGQFEAALESGETLTFSLPENKTGGCMIRLPKNGGYFIQLFPPEASRSMISRANMLGYLLVAFLMFLCALLLISLVRFYRNQQMLVEQAKNQAEIANQAKSAFLFNMSHDIRTPMNAILGYTDIALRHTDSPERVKDSLSKIKISGGHLLNLINDILEMSRIESGKIELSENPMDIREVISGVSQMSQALAIPKSIDFTTVVGDISHPFVLADELHINEVLINLISNAVKYTDEGGKVEFRTEQLGEEQDGRFRFRFSIEDSGIGMSEEFQEHLFESFSREKTATVSGKEGTGLGLSIVKRIVDLSGGTISVRSRQGEGSLFTVELPFRIMEEQAVSSFRARETAGGLVEEDALLEGKKVLLVEDNAMNREIAIDLLSELGLSVDTAEDGAIALRTVQEKGTLFYDFILMDIQMPVMDGYAASTAIRNLPDGDRVPIIALSANAFKEDMERSREAGMNDHVAKPIDIGTLLAVLHKFS